MILGFDIETDRLSPYEEGARILTAALAWGGGSIGALVDHPLAAKREWNDHDLDDIRASIELDGCTIVGHNIVAFDIPWWEHYFKTEVKAQLFDTRVAYALLDENSPKNSLEFLAEKYLGEKKNPDGLNRKKLAETDPALVLKYNAHDAMLSYKLHAPLKKELEDAGLYHLFLWLMRVARVLASMQVRGVAIDRAWVEEQSNNLHDIELRELDALRGQVGDEEVNLDSPKQLANLLYNVYRMPVVKTTATGQPSTDSASIKELRHIARGKEAKEFFDGLLEYRRVKKLRSTYLEPLASKHCGADGRVHTTYHLGRGYGDHGGGGTVTGRLSSSDPNLQNIPRDVLVKGTFVPSLGMKMFAADYSQVELRVAAWYAGEETMLAAFREGRDVHTATLAELEGVKYDYAHAKVKSGEWEENRALVKRVNFGVLYGVGEFRLVQLMRDMGIQISQKRATEIIEWWYANKRAMAKWIDDVQEIAVNEKRVVTPTGRVRRLPAAGWGNGPEAQARRQAVNFMVQSFSADLMLAALLRLEQRFAAEGGAQMLLTVHDSIVGEYYPEDWDGEDLRRVVREEMLQGAKEELVSSLGVTERVRDLLLDVDVLYSMERWTK